MVSINGASSYWLDTAEFQKGVFQGIEDLPASSSTLETAIGLYRGEFLEGVVVRDLNGEEWLAAERDRFRRLAKSALKNALTFQLASGKFEKAEELGERLVSLDMLNESSWRTLKKLLLS